jgi:hypothetical protein
MTGVMTPDTMDATIAAHDTRMLTEAIAAWAVIAMPCERMDGAAADVSVAPTNPNQGQDQRRQRPSSARPKRPLRRKAQSPVGWMWHAKVGLFAFPYTVICRNPPTRSYRPR